MNYEKIYKDLVSRGQGRKKVTGDLLEVHHILPRCLGGLDNLENLTVLTIKEHLLVHLLLVRIYPGQPKLLYAVHAMFRSADGSRDILKRSALAKATRLKAMQGENSPNFGRKRSDETRRKLSEQKRGERNPQFGKHPSPETRAKLSASHSKEKHWAWGKPVSETARIKMSAAKSGANHWQYGKPSVTKGRKAIRHSDGSYSLIKPEDFHLYPELHKYMKD